MRAVTAKKILAQARKNSRTGKVAVRKEYDRLKKEHKRHTQHPKQKITKREQRRRHLVVTEGLKEDIRKEVSKRTGVDINKPAPKSLAPKPKAHRYPRVRVKTQFGYRTLK